MNIATINEFKGDTKPPTGSSAAEKRRLFESLITGNDPESGSPMERPAYLECLKRVAALETGIAQNVGRIFGLALQDADFKRFGHDVQPHFLEGCAWDWGTSGPQMGADISNSIYGVVPEDLKAGVRDPIVAPLTKRTKDEMVQILDFGDRQGAHKVVTVTDPYHRFRSTLIGGLVNNRNGHAQDLVVKTPGQIAYEWQQTHDVQPPEQFLLDGIKIAAPKWPTNLREGIKEFGPLLVFHGIDRLGCDIEAHILKRMTVRNAPKQ